MAVRKVMVVDEHCKSVMYGKVAAKETCTIPAAQPQSRTLGERRRFEPTGAWTTLQLYEHAALLGRSSSFRCRPLGLAAVFKMVKECNSSRGTVGD